MNINKIESKNLKNLNYLFEDIRFHMGRSVLQNCIGEAYANNIENPTFAFLIVRGYCFISGNIEKENLKNIIKQYDLKNYVIVLNDKIKNIIETLDERYETWERYSLKKDPKFDIKRLKEYIKKLENKYEIMPIDLKISEEIKNKKFISITDNYEKNGIGICCKYNNKIIGVASSSIFYKDGIEVNIKVEEKYRRQGIAKAMAAQLILNCLKENKKISWDAANLESLELAKKLGFEYDSKYRVYKFI